MTKRFALEILKLSQYIPVPQEDIDKATIFLQRIYDTLPVHESKCIEIMYKTIYNKLKSALIVDFTECEVHVISILLTREQLKDNLSQKEREILQLYHNW